MHSISQTPMDRHVVAAALRGRADVIVTENVKDFPKQILTPLWLEVIRLDDFLLDQYDLSPSLTRRIVIEQAAAMKRPPVDVSELLSSLSHGGAPLFARLIAQSLPFEP